MNNLWRQRAEFLWVLLDDIDTADDLAKGNERLYRNLVRKYHAKRFEVAFSDGYSLEWLPSVPKIGD